MHLKKQFCELLDNHNWENEFVGYGNPNADILIIGQEAGYGPEDKLDYEKFYKDNFRQWNILRFDDENRYALKPESFYFNVPREKYRFPDYFVPSSPFYPKDKRLWHYFDDGHGRRRLYSSTYYWYQKLVDGIYSREAPEKYFNFFEKVFITELNGTPRKNHNADVDVNGNKYNLEENIRRRFDLLKQNKTFWSSFKVVIFACGDYATALQTKDLKTGENLTEKEYKKRQSLYESIFGTAEPFFCGQLSRYGASKSVEQIVREIKQNASII